MYMVHTWNLSKLRTQTWVQPRRYFILHMQIGQNPGEKKSKRKHLGSGLLNLNVSWPKAFFGVHSCDKGLSVSQWQELSLSHKWLIKVRYSAKLKPSQPYLPTLKAGVLNVLALRTAWGMSILWSMTQKLNSSQVFFPFNINRINSCCAFTAVNASR